MSFISLDKDKAGFWERMTKEEGAVEFRKTPAELKPVSSPDVNPTEPVPNTVADDKRFILGIDLGTSWTSVITSRGTKYRLRSVVGYPKDLIGVKLLGAAFVVGEEAYANRAYLDLRYPLTDGVLRELTDRDLDVARRLLAHVIELAEPGEDDQVCGVIGVPARASASSKALLLNMAHELLDVVIVLSEPFMVAYSEGKLLNSIVVDIGAGTTDICALRGKLPEAEDQATLLKAGNYLDQRIAAQIAEHWPGVQINTNIACDIKEKHAFVMDSDAEVLAELREDGKPVKLDVTDDIRAACESIVPDIVQQLEVLVRSYSPDQQEAVLQNIVLTGGGSRIRNLDTMISEWMKDYGTVKVIRVDDPDFAGCQGGLNLVSELPPKYWGQVGDIVGD